MANRKKYLQKWLKYQSQYERYATREILKVIQIWGKNIRWRNITVENYRSEIQRAITSEDIEEAYYNIYAKIGKLHGKRIGEEIDKSLKEFEYSLFWEIYTRNIIKFLKANGKQRIVSVEKTFFSMIANVLAKRLDDGFTLAQASKEIKNAISKPNFYLWQAKRIARTESTAAANYAATQASTVSGYAMEKEWISAYDARTRDDHAGADGQRVPEGEAFNVGGEQLMYPGDLQGSASNVVNCRCTIAVIPKRDRNGNLVPLK